jgi:hypothetical protein
MQESKLLKSFASKTECVGRSSSPLLLLTVLAPWVTSWVSSLLEETSPHQVFDVDSSSWEASREAKTPARETSSSLLLKLLLLGILIASQVVHPLSLWILQ